MLIFLCAIQHTCVQCIFVCCSVCQLVHLYLSLVTHITKILPNRNWLLIQFFSLVCRKLISLGIFFLLAAKLIHNLVQSRSTHYPFHCGINLFSYTRSFLPLIDGWINRLKDMKGSCRHEGWSGASASITFS